MRELILRDQAISDMNDWLEENPKLMRRIMRIIDECRRTPFDGLGKPEPLKGNLKGCWSRRVTDKDRLVYEVNDDFIIIYAIKEHYSSPNRLANPLLQGGLPFILRGVFFYSNP